MEYRGKTETGLLVFGFFMIGLNNEHYIIHEVDIPGFSSELKYTIVIPETVSRFSGLVDKNDNRIWENDIVSDSLGANFIVKFADWGACFIFERKSDRTANVIRFLNMAETEFSKGVYRVLGYKVTGSIHDHETA
jgi:hypothetical protein